MMKIIAKSLALAAVGTPCRSRRAPPRSRRVRVWLARGVLLRRLSLHHVHARAVGSVSADCHAECQAAAEAMDDQTNACSVGVLAAIGSGDCTMAGGGDGGDPSVTCTTCPAGCQDMIDDVYAKCGGCCDGDDCFDTDMAPEIKAGVEPMGCGGASQATPALFAALAAVANHFFN